MEGDWEGEGKEWKDKRQGLQGNKETSWASQGERTVRNGFGDAVGKKEA